MTVLHGAQRTFEPARTQLRHWIRDAALPAWADRGRDAPGFGFREHLTLAGQPAEVGFKRMRVQARQLYVFSHASLLGLHPDLAAASDAFGFMRRFGLRADGAWVRLLGRRGEVLDATADLYDLAFVLFALAWYGRASGDPEPWRLARRTAEFIRRAMPAAGGGYHDALPPPPGHRHQNPHMHLLEASLALYAATGDALYAELADELVALFRDRFHDRESGTLGEYFDAELRPAPGEAGGHVEPGHQYEWVWLLDQHASLLGHDWLPEAGRLYRFAETYGRLGSTIADAVGRDGAVRRASHRLWPQTEALKAHCAMARRGEGAFPRIATGLMTLFEQYLAPAPSGMWHDHFGPQGDLLVDKVPASSFYHLMLAFAEIEDMAAGGALMRLRPG